MTGVGVRAVKTGICLSACWLLLACATQEPNIDSAAVEDFILVRKLEHVDFIRISTNTYRDIMRQIDEYH